MAILRKLLINSDVNDEIEVSLKKMYVKRIQEMFKKAVVLESIFNIFDEVFHGLLQTQEIEDNLYNYYESYLTISSYYQHSQAGRGSLAALILKEFGESDVIEFEFKLTKLPKILGQEIKLKETKLTEQKFDIFNKSADKLVFCELKMKTYSGCTAGRIELMEKFRKFLELITTNHNFVNCLKNAGIKEVHLFGGVLFNISGEEATKAGDVDWGLCYNGLIRGKNDLISDLEKYKIDYTLIDNSDTDAFTITFELDEINFIVSAIYGNKVIEKLYFDNNLRNIDFLRERLEKIQYDDIWLAQTISLSERTVLHQFFKNHEDYCNFIIMFLKHKELQAILKQFNHNKSQQNLIACTQRAKDIIYSKEPNLQSISNIPAIPIIAATGIDYSFDDYLADIIQILSSSKVLNELFKVSDFYLLEEKKQSSLSDFLAKK